MWWDYFAAPIQKRTNGRIFCRRLSTQRCAAMKPMQPTRLYLLLVKARRTELCSNSILKVIKRGQDSYFLYFLLETTVFIRISRCMVNNKPDPLAFQIMRAHANLTGADADGWLTSRQVAGYHHDVFATYGLPARTFGGTPITSALWESNINFGGFLGYRYWCDGCASQ